MQVQPWCAQCDKPVEEMKRFFAADMFSPGEGVVVYCHKKMEWIDLPTNELAEAAFLDRAKLMCFVNEVKPEDIPERWDEIDEEVEAKKNDG